jgi:hypothetical protein
MPYSYPHFKFFIRDYFDQNIDRSLRILDVGPGAGTYSELIRHLGFKMDCLEIWEPYISRFNLTEKYDKVILNTIVDFDLSDYGYVIMGDILEHLTVDDSKKVLDQITTLGIKCLVAVPYQYEQGEYDGNPFETHLQPELTPTLVNERYPTLKLLVGDENYGYYVNN